MPKNVGTVAVDPTAWNLNDGFSQGASIMLHVPGVDLTQTAAAPITDVARSLDTNAPVVLINADTRGLDTPALVQALRTDPGLAHLPILVYQRSLQPQAEAQYLDLGASDVVGVPCTAIVLRARIRNLIRAKLRVDANLKVMVRRN